MQSTPRITAIVLDTGSAEIKAGWAGEDAPSHLVPAVVGHAGDGPLLVGAAALAQGTRLSYPFECGELRAPREAIALLRHVFEDTLRVADLGAVNVLVTASPYASTISRQVLLRLLFDEFGAGGAYVGTDAVLSLHSTGRLTGLVVDIGASAAYVAAVVDGRVARTAVARFGLTGNLLDGYLREQLALDGVAVDLASARQIKEALVQVAHDEQQAQHSRHRGSFALADGTRVTLHSTQIHCAEALFDPPLAGVTGDGLAEVIMGVLGRVDPQVRDELAHNVVLSGGGTLLPGLAERITNELTALAPVGRSVKVAEPPERQNSTWIGGSIMASLATFDQQWITRSEYLSAGIDQVMKRLTAA